MCKKVYIVMESVGQYEDNVTTPVKAFTSKKKAEDYVEKQNSYYDDLWGRYDAIGFNVDDKICDAFNAYLKDTNPDMYDRMIKSVNSKEPDDFNWDKYYDTESDFEDNEKLVLEYLKKIGLTDDEMKQIDTYNEYNQYARYDGLPHMYVSHRELELED